MLKSHFLLAFLEDNYEKSKNKKSPLREQRARLVVKTNMYKPIISHQPPKSRKELIFLCQN